MSNASAPPNDLQYPEMYVSYSPQYQGNYIPLNVVPPEYVAPGYVAPGYVAPGYVAPGYVAPDYVAIDMDIPPPPSYQDATTDIHLECRKKEEILENKHKKHIEIVKRNHQQEITTLQRNTNGSFFGGMLFTGFIIGIGFIIYRLVTIYW